MSPALKNRLYLLGAAALFSTGGAAIKAVSLNAWQVAGGRSAIAAILLLLAVPQTRRGWSLRMLPVAAAYSITLILFVLANRLTTAANAIFLQSAAPLYVLLLGPWLLHESLERRHVFYMFAILAGVSFFFIGSDTAIATAPNPPLGNVIAAASGVTYALMLIGLRWISRDSKGDPGVATAALGNVLTAVAVLPMALPVPSPSPHDWTALLYLGVVQVGLAYVLLTRGIRHVPALEATTLLVIEPALNPVWAWLVHGETPGPWSIAGGAVILAATIVNSVVENRARSSQK